MKILDALKGVMSYATDSKDPLLLSKVTELQQQFILLIIIIENRITGFFVSNVGKARNC